jgi:cytochrome c5
MSHGTSTVLLATLATIVLGAGALHATTPSKAQEGAIHWDEVSVKLPVSTSLFPAGEGADIANSQCVICHSADMVLHQPPRTQAQWKETINKMRTAYGAPIPADQVDMLAAYFAATGDR